jgi:hypothetical protein
MSTIVEALKAQGVQDPSPGSTSSTSSSPPPTILVKNSDFSPGEVYDLDGFVQSRSFRTAWVPGHAKRTATADGKALDYQSILDTYRDLFIKNQALAENTSFSPNDFYHLAMLDLLENGERPSVARRVRRLPHARLPPLHSGYLKPRLIPSYLTRSRT